VPRLDTKPVPSALSCFAESAHEGLPNSFEGDLPQNDPGTAGLWVPGVHAFLSPDKWKFSPIEDASNGKQFVHLNKQPMNQVVTYLQSKEAIFHGAMCLMLLYVPHSGSLFMQLEHLDMTFYGFTFMNWFYGMALGADHRIPDPDFHYQREQDNR
jgi:hypothetical protein